MKIVWQIDEADIAKVNAFVKEHGDDPFVVRRKEKNLSKAKPPVTKDLFWECMIGCLLTTQQRSGPTSPVGRFVQTRPFPLGYPDCAQRQDLAAFVTSTLSKFGGLRRSNIIGREAEANLSFMKNGGWERTFDVLEGVRRNSSPETERYAARFVDDHLKGFGPKQSRNLLQELGLSRYEVPIDSRIAKWLNDFGFPVKLTANALGDRNYYEFVSEGFQRLSEACGVAPCILDAVIFSSFDQGKWSEENLV